MKKIWCIAGKSGSGKTTISEGLLKQYRLNFIESYTDRDPRVENETGHTFVSKEEMDLLYNAEDVLAKTKFGDYRYCCLERDLKDINLYVIDEPGIDYLKKNFSEKYDILTTFIMCKEKDLEQRVSEDRRARDNTMFTKNLNDYDSVIWNNGSVGNAVDQAKGIGMRKGWL